MSNVRPILIKEMRTVQHKETDIINEILQLVLAPSTSMFQAHDGNFSTDILESYQRNESSLLATMLEMYVIGLSTRKVCQVVETSCGKSVSKSYVSSIIKLHDEEIYKLQNCRIEKKIPFLMTYVIYVRVRENHRVVSKAVYISIGINSKDFKSGIGFMISDSESEETWQSFYQTLMDRRLTRI